MFTNKIVGEARPAGYDAETIYNWFHRSEGPQSVLSASETILKQIITGHAEVNAMIKRVIEDSRAVWDGRAADAARGGIGPMGTWADQITQGATSAQGQVTAFNDAYHRAKNSVEPPHPQPDPRKVTFGFMGFGSPAAVDFIRAVENWQANQNHNVHVLESYGTSTNTTVRALPEFVLPDGVGGEVKPVGPPPPGPGGPPIGPPGNPGGRGPRGGGVAEGAWQGSAGQGSEQGGVSENASFVPPPPQPGQHGQAGPAPWQPEPGNQGGALGGGLGVVGGSLGIGAGSGGGGTGGGGGRWKAEAGTGTGQGGRGAAGENNRTAAGTASPARGGGKPTPTSMAGPMAGQTNKAEDEEHQRPSWLVEVDDVFTNDMQKVAPPVIGEDPEG